MNFAMVTMRYIKISFGVSPLGGLTQTYPFFLRRGNRENHPSRAASG
jgi:hypothetical protein